MTSIGASRIKASNLLYSESRNVNVSIAELGSIPVALEEGGHELGGRCASETNWILEVFSDARVLQNVCIPIVIQLGDEDEIFTFDRDYAASCICALCGRAGFLDAKLDI